MKARTSFIMKISDTISSEDEKQICAVISDAASDVKDINISDNEISYEESYELAWVEEIVNVAAKIAKLCKGKTGFEISGRVDCSLTSGEYMDYKIVFKNDKLYAQNTCWYGEHCGTEEWDEYEDFCEAFDCQEDVENDEHTYSEEFFEELDELDDVWYSSDEEIWLDKVPMGEPVEVNYE